MFFAKLLLELHSWCAMPGVCYSSVVFVICLLHVPVSGCKFWEVFGEEQGISWVSCQCPALQDPNSSWELGMEQTDLTN